MVKTHMGLYILKSFLYVYPTQSESSRNYGRRRMTNSELPVHHSVN